jgi:hypothetical protein
MALVNSGYLIGIPEDQLLNIRKQVVNQLGANVNKTIISYSIGGRTTTKTLLIPPNELLSQIQVALEAADPNTYGRVTRTSARFN